MWELTSEYAGTVEFEGLLRDGWEPFSANFLNGYGGEYRTRYYFRRQVPSSGDIDEVTERAQNIQKARDYTRTQTLKEVGRWLRDNHSSVLNKDAVNCCYILNKLQDATMKGRMP